MRSIVLISPSSDELISIFNQWSLNERCGFVCENRLSIAFKTGYIFIDYLENGKAYYDLDELDETIVNNFSFYSICYSENEILLKFIDHTVFSDGSLLDNDHGKIKRIDEFKDGELESFLET